MGIDEQLIKNMTGHRSDSVRDYKRTNPKLVSDAQSKVSCSEKAEQDTEKEKSGCLKRKSIGDFDIDDYEIPPDDVERSVNTDCLGSKCHKHNFCVDEKSECNDMCKVMKKNDQMSALRKVKKLVLSEIQEAKVEVNNLSKDVSKNWFEKMSKWHFEHCS